MTESCACAHAANRLSMARNNGAGKRPGRGAAHGRMCSMVTADDAPAKAQPKIVENAPLSAGRGRWQCASREGCTHVNL